MNWLRLLRPALCTTLLSGLDGRGPWLNSLLLDVSPLSVCGIFRSGLSGSQMNSLSGAIAAKTREITRTLLTACPSDCQRDYSWRCRTQMAAKGRAEENSALDRGHLARTTEFYKIRVCNIKNNLNLFYSIKKSQCYVL